MTALLVAIGSAMGGVGRYLVSRALNASGGMPYGTLAAYVAITLVGGLFAVWLGYLIAR